MQYFDGFIWWKHFFLGKKFNQIQKVRANERASARTEGADGDVVGVLRRVVVVLVVRTRERQLGSKIDREIQEIQRVVGCQNKVFAK